MQQKSQINPAILQPLFESASNAGEKGQAQYLTPIAWGRAFALALPRYRPIVVDLHCGAGDLLAAATRPSTTDLLGCDIDPIECGVRSAECGIKIQKVTGDVNRLYPLLRAVEFAADCFALNPPWGLQQYREPLARLAESELDTVRTAFAAQAETSNQKLETIDSTVAALCVALDRCTKAGEGYLISNDATLQRLIFDPGAPHRPLADHVWARLTISGNICTDKANPMYAQVNTGVIWFARDHDGGLHPDAHRTLAEEVGRVTPCAPSGINEASGAHGVTRPTLIEQAELVCADFQKRRLDFRNGAEIRSYGYTADDTLGPWKAAADEWQRTSRKDCPQWNIWLRPDGSIATDLTGYDVRSGRVSKAAAEPLYSLNGQQPMQLVMQRTKRGHLERAILGTGWRVDPALQDALKRAVEEYHSVRAPIVPLSPIQRLGFLDEKDEIVCAKDLDDSFDADATYKLRSASVAVKRKGQKANLSGGYDDCEWDGQELAFFITDRRGVERVFMEKRLRAKTIHVSLLKPGEKPGSQRQDGLTTCAIDFTLNELVEHFIVPEVPDVATINPAGYTAKLKLIDEVEAVCPGLRLVPFQRQDLARTALHDGVILGHDPGLGKGLSAYVWPCLKVGLLPHGPLTPKEPVLLLASGDLHSQIVEEGMKHFGTKPVRLDSQATFLRLSTLNPKPSTRQRHLLAPGYYLSSYHEVAHNGVVEFPELDRSHPRTMMDTLNLPMSALEEWFAARGERYKEDYARLKITDRDLLSTLTANWYRMRRDAKEWMRESLDASYYLLKDYVPERSMFNVQGSGFDVLSPSQATAVMLSFVVAKHTELRHNLGETKYYPDTGCTIKCVYSPSLGDLAQDSFAVVVPDEATKIKGEATLIGRGTRQFNPPYRLLLTGTPIKNRVPDFFWLAHWATGGRELAHPRFPFGVKDSATFAEQFCFSERNLSAEERSEKKRKLVRLTPQVCNIHLLWKLIAPIVLRRRQQDCGENIVQRHHHLIRVPMGTEQAEVYGFHLMAKYLDKHKRPATGARLTALRIAAANPASELLVRPDSDQMKTKGKPRSSHPFIPKLASALAVIQEILEKQQQFIVFSAFHDSLDVLALRLRESGVKYLVADGRTSPHQRGIVARQFKRHHAGGVPGMLAGVACMSQGHSFNRCENVILLAYSWAMDEYIQAIMRIHRMNSKEDVHVWSILCNGSIDHKLDSMRKDKNDAAELVLDGHLLGENPQEVNLAELLKIAQKEFAAMAGGGTIDERELVKDWPAQCCALNQAMRRWGRPSQVIDLEPVIPHAAIPTPNLKNDQLFADLPLWQQAA